MKEWVAIGIAAITLLVVLIGGVWYAAHQDQQLVTVVQEVQKQGDTLNRVDRQVAWIAGHLGVFDDSFEDSVRVIPGVD